MSKKATPETDEWGGPRETDEEGLRPGMLALLQRSAMPFSREDVHLPPPPVEEPVEA